MSSSSNLNVFRDEWLVDGQLLFCGVLLQPVAFFV